MAAAGSTLGELPRNVLAVLFILGLTAGCLLVLSPFLTPLVCATTLAIATWPLLTGLERRFGGRRGPAIAVMTAAIALVFLLPLAFGSVAIVQSIGRLTAWVRDLSSREIPPLPAWVDRFPLLASRLHPAWEQLEAGGAEGLKARLAGNTGEILRWLLARLGNVAGMLVQVLVTLAITAGLYLRGERAATTFTRLARRLGGENGVQAARLAASATRGVALGVILTPLIQSILAGIAMAVIGVPQFALFALLVLVSCLAQAGPIPPLLIPTIWLFARGHTGAGIAMAGAAVLVHVIGPVLRPMLIKRGVDLPFALILAGVLGGVAAFGVIGLVIGPVLLAVTSALLSRWMEEGETRAQGAGAPGGTV